MKKIFLLTILMTTSLFMLNAQTVEITPFAGYVFPARWYAANGSLYFHGNAQYGGMISLGVSRVVDFNFFYNRIDTKASAEAAGYSSVDVPISENFYMLGFTKNFRVNPTVSPYLGMSLGGVYMAPKDTDYYSYWFFAMGFDGGVKVYFNKHIGLKFQAQMLMPIQGGGFAFYYGGSSSVYVTSTLIDFGFNGGLIFRLGKVD